MTMRRPRRKYVLQEMPTIIHLWLFRVLVSLGAHRDFIQRGGLSDDNIAEAVGLGHLTDDQADSYSMGDALATLRGNARVAERQRKMPAVPKQLAVNTRRLAKLVGLSSSDCRILEFVVLMHNERVLSDAVDLLGDVSARSLPHILTVLLDLPESEVRESLDAQGVLMRSGLISIDRKSRYSLSSKLEVLSRSFAELMLTSKNDPVTLLREMVIPGPAAVLSLSDYKHIEHSLRILCPYLERAVTEGRTGVNVLLYGAPGTGKTELARVLAQVHNFELFEVTSEDSDGDPVESSARLRAYRAAQSFFSQRRALIVFDEIEDVFSGEENIFGTRVVKRKAWMNRTLERNRVPALWISNSVECLDPAVVRRFDQVIELTIPPLGQRKRIIEGNCKGILDARDVARLAKSETLAPAIVHRAASVINLIKNTLESGSSSNAITALVDSTLRAQGHKISRKASGESDPEIYDPAFIHSDADLLQVADGLRSSKAGRLCLFGPPGTGKTAYAHWLADRLDLPLTSKRASDLLSPWVGDNERNIAKAFERAERDEAVLLIDEADSFLLDRRTARRSWEISLTNELLTQMEAFQGIFIASTNLIEGIDQAALRRFDLKARFGFLLQDQAWTLLQRHCSNSGIGLPATELRDRLNRLESLTPGDFAAVARRHRFEPMASSLDWVVALEADAILKRGGKNRIGF